MKRIILYLLLGICIVSAVGTTASPAFAATITDQMIESIKKVDLPSGGEEPDNTAIAIVGRLIGAVLGFLGVVFMVLVIYGGFKWLTAAGKDEEIDKGKDIIRAAIIGLIIVLASYAISRFVTTAIQGAVQ